MPVFAFLKKAVVTIFLKLSKNPVKESNFLLLLGLSVWVLQNCTSEIVFRLALVMTYWLQKAWKR